MCQIYKIHLNQRTLSIMFPLSSRLGLGRLFSKNVPKVTNLRNAVNSI